MKKYKTEDNIDFFNELYKSLDEKEDTLKTEADDDKCLITNQQLTDKFVKLNCGHKFNYIPLFNDVKNHKIKFNSLEGNGSVLKENEIRCPYCRKKQSSVLPYYEELLLEKINGVNHYDASNSNVGCFLSQNGCQFTYKYKFSDGTTKDYGCPLKHIYNSEDGKQYCYQHNEIIKKLLIKKQAQKIKDDAKKATLEALNKAKEEKQKAKEEKEKAKEEKEKAKEEKEKIKEEIKKITEEKHNIKEEIKKTKEDKKKTNELKKAKSQSKTQLITHMLNLENEENTIIEQPTIKMCGELLKTGKQCSKNIYLENVCKRHYNLKNKENKDVVENKDVTEN